MKGYMHPNSERPEILFYVVLYTVAGTKKVHHHSCEGGVVNFYSLLYLYGEQVSRLRTQLKTTARLASLIST